MLHKELLTAESSVPLWCLLRINLYFNTRHGLRTVARRYETVSSLPHAGCIIQEQFLQTAIHQISLWCYLTTRGCSVAAWSRCWTGNLTGLEDKYKWTYDALALKFSGLIVVQHFRFRTNFNLPLLDLLVNCYSFGKQSTIPLNCHKQ